MSLSGEGLWPEKVVNDPEGLGGFYKYSHGCGTNYPVSELMADDLVGYGDDTTVDAYAHAVIEDITRVTGVRPPEVE